MGPGRKHRSVHTMADGDGLHVVLCGAKCCNKWKNDRCGASTLKKKKKASRVVERACMALEKSDTVPQFNVYRTTSCFGSAELKPCLWRKKPMKR